MVEDDRGDSRELKLFVSRGERATGATRALTERAPMTMEARVILENMVNGRYDSGTRPDVWVVGEDLWWAAQRLRRPRSVPRLFYS